MMVRTRDQEKDQGHGITGQWRRSEDDFVISGRPRGLRSSKCNGEHTAPAGYGLRLPPDETLLISARPRGLLEVQSRIETAPRSRVRRSGDQVIR